MLRIYRITEYIDCSVKETHTLETSQVLLVLLDMPPVSVNTYMSLSTYQYQPSCLLVPGSTTYS